MARTRYDAAKTDTRWAVTMGQRVAPAPLDAARGRMTDGLRELVAAGLATGQDEAPALTPTGLALADALSAPLLAAALVTSAPAGHAVVVDAHVSFVCSALTMLVTTWDEDDSGFTTRLAVVDAPIALRLLLDLLDPGALPTLDASPAPAAPAVLPPPPARVAPPAWTPAHGRTRDHRPSVARFGRKQRSFFCPRSTSPGKSASTR